MGRIKYKHIINDRFMNTMYSLTIPLCRFRNTHLEKTNAPKCLKQQFFQSNQFKALKQEGLN